MSRQVFAGRLIVLGTAFSLAVPAFGQISASGPSDGSATTLRFQVTTVKPSRPEESRSTQIRGNRFATTGTSVLDLLKYCYGLQEQEIVGGPKWLKTETFDIVGDPETQTRPSSDDFKEMVQNLLTDRFHLTAHRETRDLSVLEIVRGKDGPKLNTSTRPADGIPTVGYSPGQLSAANATLADLATFLQRFVADRPVFDRTGIAGKYDLNLRWTPDDLDPRAGRQRDNSEDSFPGLFTAIQEQLGLKLQKAKLPVQVFVVDHAETPSEN